MHMCIYLMTLVWSTMIPIHDDDHYRSSFIRKHFSNNSFFFNVSLPVHRKMPERGKQCMIYPFNFMFYQQIIHRNWAKKSVILIEFGFCVQDETELWSNPYVFVWTVDRTFFVQEQMELRRSSRNWNSRSSTKCSGQMFDVGGESKGVACLKRNFIGFVFPNI